MTLEDKLRAKGIKPPVEAKKERSEPVWKGPEQDGITFSLLSRFLVCRERFRVQVIEGLGPKPTFNHRLEYGNMWHACEEFHAKRCYAHKTMSDSVWHHGLHEHCQSLLKKYPFQKDQVQHWYEVCKAQFPLYVSYWAQHEDMKGRTPLLSEVVFAVPYTLPSRRVVTLRGKWDSVDLVGKGRIQAIWLQENKTKGDVNESKIGRQLKFDLQTMIYLIALDKWQTDGINSGDFEPDYPELYHKIKGVRYNVIRRPLSGGKGSIVQHKPSKANPQGETKAHFYERVAQYIKDEPEAYFMRWNVEITPEDIQRFRTQTLDPILEQLCDWWEWVTKGEAFAGHPTNPNCLHWRHPFGVWNVLDEGGSTDLDEYLDTGSEVGLSRITNLFPELKP